jgi:predicted alpha/beta superfamily hydrolase
MPLPSLLLCAVLAASPAPAPVAREEAPPHASFTVASRSLREPRRINVYTPPGYAEAKGARYPVLYMPDGGLQEDFPHLSRSVDAAIRAGEMRPVILVGIENTERRRDMTGPTQVAEDRKIAPRVGGSAAFRAFLRDELMPEVRRRYRTTRETAIIGESLAGLFVVETFLVEPKLFDTYLALSPSLWWNGEALTRQASGLLAAHPAASKALYFASTSDDTIAPAAERLAEALRTRAAKGLRWQYELRPDLRHDNVYREASPQLLRTWLAPVTKQGGAKR